MVAPYWRGRQTLQKNPPNDASPVNHGLADLRNSDTLNLRFVRRTLRATLKQARIYG
jgi:hypothetical protein